ncbi:MAG: metal ABC transporter substrate-binding protein [Rhodospirillales bacterium]|nr:metal ABC transporter substrate-binding protein [Rhodospirillales bacterium]
MFRRFLLAATPLLAVGPAFAQSTPTGARIKVVATFSILADLVGEVGGERIELSALVGPDTDAHTYQPRPTDARTLAAAQAMVSNGLGFEGWIDRLAKAAPFKGRAIVASKGVPTIAAGPAHGHGHAHGPDPHCWQDVARVRRYVANIAQGLAEADPANAAFYKERATAYDRRLADLDQWVKAEIAKVPAAQRKAITGHDSFGYFSKAYGVQFMAPRGYNTESEPSAKDVAALIRQVREQKIKALFVENMTNPGMVEQIARESGAAVGPRLYSDALSKSDGPAATYEAMMRHNVTALVQGMLKN